MNKFFESYFYEDEFLIADVSIIDKLFKKNPDLLKCYEHIATELDELNRQREIFMHKYKLVISFHPYYQLYKDIDNPSRSIKKSKDKYLKCSLSFSIASKSKALIVTSEDDEFIYIPNSLKNKRIYIETLDSFSTHTTAPIFNTKKPIRKDLISIVEQLTSLNDKLSLFEKRKIPFTLLANELNWSKVFFPLNSFSGHLFSTFFRCTHLSKFLFMFFLFRHKFFRDFQPY